MTKLACAVDEIKTLAPGEVSAVLDKDKKGDFVLLGMLSKNNWRRSSCG